MEVLNEGGFVFGDLRRLNIMLADKANPHSDDSCIRFIHFDWVGKEGKDLRFPFHLSGMIRGVTGATEYDMIQKKHQDYLFNAL